MPIKNYILLITLAFTFFQSIAQEDFYQKFLVEEVENINPVYKPVVGFGVGMFTFLGDVKNTNNSFLHGNPAFKVNVSGFIDGPRYFKYNGYGIVQIGSALTVNQYSYSNPEKNWNFQTDILLMGTNVQYDFGHFLNKNNTIKPFISVGAEVLKFSSQTDLSRADIGVETKYNYWADGTIRDIPQNIERPSNIIKRDYIYETDLRSADPNQLGVQYSQNVVAIPLEIGLDFMLGNRVNVKLATSYHLTFTDYIDGVTSDTKSKILKGDAGSDKLLYTYTSVHFDLFSDPKTLLINKLFAELEDFDYALMGDEDNDWVLDANDNCLGTPKGIDVDSLGCPFDDDKDGVPNFKDKDLNTPQGAIVDVSGIEIPDDDVWANLDRVALNRSDVEAHLNMLNNLSGGSGRRNGNVPIPPKFKGVDKDLDGYISFDEVLKAIDAFFDFDTELNTQDVYELNEFFFAQ